MATVSTSPVTETGNIWYCRARGLGNLPQHIFRDVVVRHTDVGYSELLAERDYEVLFAEVSPLHEQLGETLSRRPVHGDALLKLVVRDELLLE